MEATERNLPSDKRAATLPRNLPSDSRPERLPRIGKISAGQLVDSPGGKQCPTNLPHFIASPTKASNSPEAIEAFRAVYGATPQRIEVMFPFNTVEENLGSALRCYGAGAGLLCKSVDGHKAMAVNRETGELYERPCGWQTGCEAFQRGDCRETHCITLMLPKVRGIGVWQYDTGSPNNAKAISGALLAVKAMGVAISRVPFIMERQEVECQVKGKKRRVWITVLRQMSFSPEELVAQVRQQALAGGDMMGILPAPSLVEPADESKPADLYPDDQADDEPPAELPQAKGEQPTPAAEYDPKARIDKGRLWDLEQLTKAKFGEGAGAIEALKAAIATALGKVVAPRAMTCGQAETVIEELRRWLPSGQPKYPDLEADPPAGQDPQPAAVGAQGELMGDDDYGPDPFAE